MYRSTWYGTLLLKCIFSQPLIPVHHMAAHALTVRLVISNALQFLI
jgi:hypothetical protein